MSYKSSKIIAIISAIIFCVSVGMCIVASIVVIKQKNTYLESLQSRAEAEVREQSQKRLAEALEKTKSERALLSSQILPDANVIELLSLIELLGKEQAVTLTTNSLNVDKIDKKFETLVINLQVAGPYVRVMHMLELLEHLPYQASVSTVQLERENEAADSNWKGTFTLKVTKFKKNET